MANGSTKERDRGHRKIRQRLKRADGLSLKVGYFDKPHKGSGATIAELAVIHSRGAPRAGIPKRDWITPTIDRNRQRYQREQVKLVQEAVALRRTFESAVFELGQIVVGDFQKAITGLKRPPLKPSTARQKGSTNPLIDDGFLRAGTEARMFIRGARIK